ncbi:MFS transporter [Desulfobaculum bizertense]|uniref:Predicted arabinose efflux permease, MFS family n=1 Tax=Desulfobaculum bizertense DSM 18034 TaxID=1121442 RepID=A0A1T4WC43_9BACT|nr:MFS transporter [Desulfobaculum bizertense]UIJ37522.1 MFS transporter [Desulfobaculum bizertense]SKA74495.1 Predicted arabinose efflux permease, MFS family [Desulfobaculum bizertense DSM 18034]
MDKDVRAQRRGALYAVTATQFAVPFMVSAVAVALPAVGREFAAKATQISLVESAYLCAVSMLMLPFARFSDIFGRKFTFASGVGLFMLASLVLGFVPNMGTFILVRIIQGIGAAAQISTGLAIISDVFPREERGRAFGIGVAGVYLGLSMGPFLGGEIATHFGWRWIFFVGVPICGIALFQILYHLDVRPRFERGLYFDWAGCILSALGTGLIVFGGAEWNNTFGKVLFGIGLLSVIGFILWEKRAKAPLLDIELFARNRVFSFGCAVQFINYAATFGVTFLMSLYLQYAQGMTPGQAGRILMVQPVLQAIISPLSGRWADRYPPHKIATYGMCCGTAGLVLAEFLGMQSSVWMVVGVLLLFGLGTALFSSPNVSVIMGSVGPEDYAVASAMTGGMRTTGMTMSMVAIGMILSMYIGNHPVTAANVSHYIQAMKASFLGFTAVSVFGIWLSIKGIPRNEAPKAA